jgi:hypothetical protein
MELNLKDDEKDEFIDYMLRQYRLVDAFWFLAVEDKFGLDHAVELNEKVWRELAGKTAREIKRRFKIDRKGLEGLILALNYFPWSVIIDYKIERKDNKLIIKVPNCPPQKARVEGDRGEFPCKEMHYFEFKNFAKEIDEKIEVRCVFAPPDEHPEDLWCQWEFWIEDD